MLTESEVRALKPRGKDYQLSDDTRQRTGWRLIIRVRSHGTKEWLLRVREAGKYRFKALGTYPDLSLEQAREEARRRAGDAPEVVSSALVLSDLPEPLEGEYAAARENFYGTLGELCTAYRDDLRERGAKSSEEIYTKLQRYVQRPFPHLWKKQARDIQVTDLRDILAFHIQRGVTTTTNRIRAWLHAAFQLGLTCENDPRRHSDVKWGLVLNPAAHIPIQADWERQGERVLSSDDVRLAWHNLPTMRTREASAVPVVLLCIATAGQRLTALLRLTVDDVHLGRKLVDMPAAGTKNGRPHVVPLSKQAIAILAPRMERARRRGHKLLFPNHRNPEEHMLVESASSLVAQYRHQFNASPWTPRDIRRTGKTVLGELGVQKQVRDLLHGHAMQDVSSKHYDRYDYLKEKREAMAVWEKWLEGVLQGDDIRIAS